MNESTELMVVNAQNAVQIFTGGGMAAVLDGIEAKVRAIKLDPSTPAGREDIRSTEAALWEITQLHEQDRIWLLYKGVDQTVGVMVDDSCGTVCCLLHRAERGAGATYCRDHWMTWKEVA